MKPAKPVVEVLVEGELSPFEHEALYQLLRKKFRVEQPSYTELSDDTLVTRINLSFHHAYSLEFFTELLREDWRELKEIFREVRHRRGRAGAAFNLAFTNESLRVVFRTGLLNNEETGSALDQIGHLTGVLDRMTGPEIVKEPLVSVEGSFDGRSDRWHQFRGFTSSGEKSYLFDEKAFTWRLLEKATPDRGEWSR
jgi:hypothetical protein